MHALFMTVSSIRSHFQVSNEIGAAEICGLDFFANRVGVVSLKKLRLGGTARSCVGGGQGGTALHEEWLLQNVFFGELVIPKVMSSPQK